MEIVVGKFAGFCSGVRHAVIKAKEEALKGKIYCLGEIVHNKQVIEKLEKNGMITVNSLDEIPDGEKMIIRAHGEAENVYLKAKEKNIEILDLTCRKVKAIHDRVKEVSKDSFIIIIGKKGHPETNGTKGFAGENSFIIQTEDDILDAYKEYEKTNLGKIYVVCQTTISPKIFENLRKEIETNFIEAEIIIDNTICNATELRQKEVFQMSEKSDIMIIIGGKNSANTKELFNIAKMNCNTVYAIETVEDLKGVEFSQNDKIGIMAGASTPKSSIMGVKEYLENYYKGE